MDVAVTPDEIAAPADRLRSRSGGLRRYRLIVNACRLAILVVTIGGWELAARLHVLDPFFFGEPSGVLAQLIAWIQHGTQQGPLWVQVAVTLEETVYGFVGGVVLGTVFGILLGRVDFLADTIGPFIRMANSFPRIVLGSIFVIWLGLGVASKALLAVVLVFFLVFYNSFEGVREVDLSLLANARILGASRRAILFEVTIPSALSWITTSLHTALGFALIGAVVGEFLGSAQGLGLLISNAQGTFNPNGVFAGMLILGVLALAAEALMTRIEQRLFRWRTAGGIAERL